MKSSLKKELPLILLSTLPVLYLAYVWPSLPDQVPMQWDLKGNVNRYGGLWEILILGLMPIFFYILFLLIPKLDPKKRLEAMGNKFYSIRLVLAVFIGVLFMHIIYSIKEGSLANPNYVFIKIGGFFVLLGNYFTTIKPNYFIGIRTPWTLESEKVWKSTHRLAAKLWIPGGLLIGVSGFIFAQQTLFITFLIITVVIVLIPVAHSYLKFRNESKIIE